MSKNMIFPTPELLEAAIEGYFDETPRDDWRIEGLAVYLKISSKVLRDYQRREGYQEIVEYAKTKIADAYEERGCKSKTNPVFSIFALKQTGWDDHMSQSIDLSANMSLENRLKALNGDKF